MWDMDAPAVQPFTGEGRSLRSAQRTKQPASEAGGSALTDEHLFSMFAELDMPLGVDGGDLSPSCDPLGSAKFGSAAPAAPGVLPYQSPCPAPSWDEPADAGASASDGGLSGEPDLDELDEDSGDDSGPPRGRGGRGRGRGARCGRGHSRPAAEAKARGRGRVRARARELEDADEWTDGEDEEADVGGGRGRVKRVMANRQSAQRSRMRKLQFISDLEAEVSRLQGDLAQLSPTVAALRTKHAGLTVTHDELRACAIGLVQKCRQAESVNALLRQECQRLRSAQQGRPPHFPVALSDKPPGRSCGVGAPGFAEPTAFLASAGMLQTGTQLQG
ncbi:hypothetical protein WJX81_007875 [Elliptochloris bilobata]|uniref:BZIP domain-containing protein n=1 Tax=Elliptochloris bilobata TaxID=381761 RepID=A0AAW1S8B7_9CHLO